MPQPLSRVAKITSFRGGAAVILEVPELAALITAIITSWAEVEASLGRIVGVCLQADSPAGMAMYLGLSGGAAKRAVLKAAVEVHREGKYFSLFELVMKLVKPVRDRRNDLAHGLWQVSDQLPDALLWTSQYDEIASFGMYLRSNLEVSQSGKGQVSAGHREVMVYRKSDLEKDLDHSHSALAAVHRLGVVMNPQYAHGHVEMLDLLLGALPIDASDAEMFRQTILA